MGLPPKMADEVRLAVFFRRGALLSLSFILGFPQPAVAQDRRVQSPYGSVGQRQTREDAAPNTTPTQRIRSRLDTRAKTRLSTRLDRQQEPRSDALKGLREAARKAQSPDER